MMTFVLHVIISETSNEFRRNLVFGFYTKSCRTYL